MIRRPLLATTALRFALAALCLILPAATLAQTFACTDYSGGRSGVVQYSGAALTFTADADAAVTDRTISLTNTASTGQLCTLLSLSPSSDGSRSFYVPVGRSYDGRDWERVAGKHARLSFACAGGACTVTLPNAGGADPAEYYMTAYEYVLTGRQAWARFLERASFGPRPSDVDGASGAADDMAAHVAAEFAKDETSHREYFRRRLNPRSIETYKYGVAGPHPCAEHSRWRDFAFTRKDKVMSVGPIKRDWPMTMHYATLQAREYSSVTKYAWLFAGHVRTILDAQPRWSDGSSTAGAVIDADSDYRVCGVDEVSGVGAFPTDSDEGKRTLYARFQLQDPNDNDNCRNVFGGNPKVHLDTNYMGSSFSYDFSYMDEESETADIRSEAAPWILDMETSFTPAADLEDIGYDPTAEGGVGHDNVKAKSDSVVRLKKTDYRTSNTDICDQVPDPAKADYRSMGWEYSPYFEGRSHPDWDPSHRSVPDPEVFALFAGGVHRIHDRRFTPLENTIAAPLHDGGGGQTLASVFREMDTDDADDATLQTADHDENPRTASTVSGNEQAVYCSNARPNVFNEAGCTLSLDEDACVREGRDDEDTVAVVTLTPEPVWFIGQKIKEINDKGEEDLLAAGIPAVVVGLDFVESTPKPCETDAVSRWTCSFATGTQDSETNCYQGSITPGEATVLAFQHLFKYAVTNNEYFMDVRMYEAYPGMACDDAQSTANTFRIWAPDVSHQYPWSICKCWKNVHPDDFGVYLVKDKATQVFMQGSMLPWTTELDSSLTTDAFLTWKSNAAKAEYWGKLGDKKTLNSVLGSLNVYGVQGGLPVTDWPTSKPSASPSSVPSTSFQPSTSQLPSLAPSESPSTSTVPSQEPSVSLEPSISAEPSSAPSTIPSAPPSVSSKPSDAPSASGAPSSQPSQIPVASAILPSESPSSAPSSVPSDSPSTSGKPSESPSVSAVPSIQPSVGPSIRPSFSGAPSDVPSNSGVPTLPPSQLSHVARTTHDTVADLIANDPSITQVILETQMTSAKGGVLVCGSEGEISSDVNEDDYFDYWNWRLDSSKPESEQKKTVWTNIALIDHLAPRSRQKNVLR